jgi:hypothetical protein
MNSRALLALSTALICGAAALAQEPPAKGGRKSLTFQPGAKTPDATPAPAAPASAPANAPAAPNPLGIDEPGQAAAAFFSLIQKNQIDEAYAAVTKGSKIAERPEELTGLKGKTREALDLFGPISGYDLVETKSVGKVLLRRTYLSLGRDFPLRWRFYFYLSDKQWRLVDLRVDDRLSGMFGEADDPPLPAPQPAGATP